MSKLEKYSSYKDSGVEWVSSVPKHWDIIKIKYLMYEKKKTHNINLNCGSISFGKVVHKDDEKIPYSTKKAYQVVESGNFLVNPLNLNYDLKSLRIALSDLNVVVSSGYIVLDTLRDMNKTYLNYLLHRFDVAFMKTLGAGVRQTLNYTDISECELIEPPKQEQIKIASYLDTKTEQLDKAIKQKEQLIELLKERRQILINDAVTKGVPHLGNETLVSSEIGITSGTKVPPPKMKDSGVEWIGEIPEGWEVKKLKYIFKFGKGLTITKDNLADEGIKCVNYGEIHSKYGFEINPEVHNLKCVDANYLKSDKKSLLNFGDFIYADTSEDIEGSGNFTYLNSTIKTFAGYHTVICRPKIEINSRFFAYEFDSLTFRYQIQKKVKGVKVYSITQGMLKDMIFWLPPVSEQQELVKFLDSKTSKLDNAVDLQQYQIDKLKEYKTTLIDSVVTGKVRVL